MRHWLRVGGSCLDPRPTEQRAGIGEMFSIGLLASTARRRWLAEKTAVMLAPWTITSAGERPGGMWSVRVERGGQEVLAVRFEIREHRGAAAARYIDQRG